MNKEEKLEQNDSLEDTPNEDIQVGQDSASEEEIVHKLQREVFDYKDKYLRNLAELDNARKRLQKEKIETQSYALQNIILDVLSPIDNLENALKFVDNASHEVKNWAYGFQMILAQFNQVLANHGVTAFDAVGQLFDPHMHEAVEAIETKEAPEGTVIEQYLKGYKMGSRVIRPARVKVATAPQNMAQVEEIELSDSTLKEDDARR